MGIFIDHVEHAVFATVMGAVFDEVIGPDVVAPLGPQADTGAVVEPQTPTFRLFAGHLEPLTSPDPLDPLVVH